MLAPIFPALLQLADPTFQPPCLCSCCSLNPSALLQRGLSPNFLMSVHLKAEKYGFQFHFFFFNLFIYFWLCWSSPPCEGPPQSRQAGATPHHGARASHHRGLFCCGAQAPDAQAQQPWLTGPVAPRHVGSSQTRARTRVPCTGRQTPNHRATREALSSILICISLIMSGLSIFSHV